MISNVRRTIRPAILTRQASVLSGTEREKALADLTSAGWSVVPDRDAIQKKYLFEDFVQAWGFMSRYLM